MTYSTVVKNELCEIVNINSCCMVSEICAIVRMVGNWVYNGDDLVEILIRTENEKLADIFTKGIKKFYGINVINAISESANKRRVINNLSISKDDITDDLVNDLKSVIPEYYNFEHSKSGKCCTRAFLRGAFLASGSISNPRKTYHLEISTKDEETALILSAFFNDFHINPKILLRNDTFVVYIKDAEDISNFLNIVGAHQAMMNYENIRIEKNMRNNVNRAVNCETANIQKTLDASFKQLKAIRYIADTKGLSYLKENLKQVAMCRIENPDLGLADLGEELDPPLGKSGVSHRMKKIINIANELQEKESEEN